jgi:hypothetical protein
MSCPHEERAARLAATSPDDSWLVDHARDCEECAGLIEVSRWMQEMEGADDAVNAARLPSAGQIWWKARVAAREAAAEKALRPLRLVESATVAAALVGAGAALMALVRGLPDMMDGPALEGARMLPGTISAGVAVAVGVAVFITTVAVRRLLARD